MFDIFFQVARNAVHPNDHRNHEEGSDEQQQALKAVFADLPALQSHGDRQAQRGSGGYTVPSETGEMRAAGARQINEDNADNEGSFDTLTEGNEKGSEQRNSS